MQVLKEEVKAAILTAACAEFMEKGYMHASMRSIAKQANISAGNLYRYYPNKEELFYAITTPAYTRMLALNEHDSGKIGEGMAFTLEQMITQIGHVMGGLLLEYRKEMLILLDGSAGTKYQDAKNQIVTVFAKHVQEHLERSERYTDREPGFTGQLAALAARPLSVSFLEGLFEIMRLYEDEQRIRACTMRYIDILFQGFGRLV
ncbi:TetR/AcrR family transcriptional regulator [Paenibacillus aquistagni]|uniref:TetR/AcrR family transcriptional regulator n=1 Tax=Paenibacillus aquistagni TaxID=1852522 RepID=UPI00145B9612|nr:TetR/AcrR family transcriptional regulator [Paenibacillus aquistagni]NMM52327.1 TetR/AcrR family transcriptional regulator [Paenibacillus aquistagni]